MSRYLGLIYGFSLLIVGCGTSGPVPQDRFYQLNIPSTIVTRPVPVLSGGLIIDRVSADPLRSGRAILFSELEKPLELKRYHYEFWVDQPPELVQRALLEYFRETGLADRVIQGHERSDTRYRLSTRLQRFEQLRDSARGSADVEVEIEATLFANSSRAVLWTRRYRQRQPVGASGMHATAAAMEAALGGVLRSMDKDLSALQPDR